MEHMENQTKRVEVSLSLQVVAPLLDVIKAAADSLRSHLAVGASPVAEAAGDAGDEEMAALWRGSLLESQNAGVDALLALFDSRFFKTGMVSFDAGNGARILRACAAVRLAVRGKFLKMFSDEALEQGIGDVDLKKYPESVGRAMMCYMFLATIQEVIIGNLGEEL